MQKMRTIIAFVALMGMVGCAVLVISPDQEVTGRIIHRGVFDCFPKGLQTPKGELATCETSAVVYSKGKLIFASDKPIPGEERSSVFSMKLSNSKVVKPIQYLTHNWILKARKFEGMTVTPDGPDGKKVIATTGFDRVKKNSAEWDPYNSLLSWPATVGQELKVNLVSKSIRDGIESSRGLRSKFQKALQDKAYPKGPGYYKVEGLAAIPENRLLFGIREIGKSYKEFDYSIQIIRAFYEIRNKRLTLKEDFKRVYQFDPPKMAPGGKPVGLSSIEYDPFHKRLYLLTSFETEESDEGLGGYLWTLSLKALEEGKPPSLVRKKDGKPLMFAHKPEGLAVISKNKIIVVHDDDRVTGRKKIDNPETQFYRLPHQAAYTIVELK